MATPSGRISNEPEEERRREKNAIYSGHLRLCQQPRAAHALRSDQNWAFWVEYLKITAAQRWRYEDCTRLKMESNGMRSAYQKQF